MEIDWLTVAAQIVNFLVLVWLLQRFLYRPITRAMERREQRIAERLHAAERSRAAAESEAEAFRRKQEDLEARREQLLSAAREEAERDRKALQAANREEIEIKRREWLKQVEDQQSAFLREVRQQSTTHFCRLARQALGELADAELEARIARVFVDKLTTLDQAERAKLAAACERAGGGVTISSRFEMSPQERRYITKAVREQIFEHAEVSFAPGGEGPCGLELKAGSQRLSWGLDGYFDGLEDQLGKDIGMLTPSSR
jgi:F-type H+-transporting ATPase subunit b